MFEDVKTIILDYDGTIHNSIKIYGPAFRKAYDYLVEEGVAEPRQWRDEEISYWLGFSSKNMWRNFMPELDPTIRDRASKMIGKEMLRRIEHREAELYEGALETLKDLKTKGYHLVFLSNCSISYRDMARDTFGLDDYFQEMACSEEYAYIPKYDILKEIKGNYPEKMVMIGDRFQDIEAGKKNNIFTIGCAYGFSQPGEIEGADVIINDIQALKQLF